ncbi:hypothetical protein JOC86_000354 [Bacillus pakistanensis]|uniref:Uncharacterized protein n=1 Tax=Rossellomorea pakistanensis TaxID=992288 RepID=A0ABS2N7I4_9BACI|nr:hypothetical protein [Bacillus pakistanensis]MBM7583817.1 hypothetical protein [Bacillus pakistanensis]
MRPKQEQGDEDAHTIRPAESEHPGEETNNPLFKTMFTKKHLKGVGKYS